MNNPIMYVDPSGYSFILAFSLLLATMIGVVIISAEYENAILSGPNAELSGPEWSFSDEIRVSLISGDAYLAKKESKKRDCLNGYTYFKFLNAGLNIGYTLKSKNEERRKILNFDLSIFEFGYSNNYFSISFALGLNPIDVSLNLENIFKN